MSDSYEMETQDDVSFVADSRTRWFVRGTAVGMLVMASINAISYFFRSADWSSLIGKPKSLQESVGFPLKVWEAGNTYGGMFVDYPRLGLNILAAAMVGAVVGWITASRTDFLNGLIHHLQSESTRREPPPVQFSLQGMLVGTAFIALIAAIARNFAARPETLIAIYLLGPTGLVALAMLPKRLSWQRRVVIIIPTTLALIAAAIAVGTRMEMEFDKVMMGIFLCWTPQSALAAIALTAFLLFSLNKEVSQRALSPGEG
ncbi:MAG: hypothetical protein AB8B91_25645 [Rubripirellula sp.]